MTDTVTFARCTLVPLTFARKTQWDCNRSRREVPVAVTCNASIITAQFITDINLWPSVMTISIYYRTHNLCTLTIFSLLTKLLYGDDNLDYETNVAMVLAVHGVI